MLSKIKFFAILILLVDVIIISCRTSYGAETVNLTPHALNCSDLPLGNYTIGTFASKQEYQTNPEQTDLSELSISTIDGKTVNGFVTNKAGTFSFRATCHITSYEGIPELRLNFEALPGSMLNGCSGIYNASNSNKGLNSALYLGGPSLVTGDNRFNLCEKKRYGLITPPQPAADNEM